MALFEFTLVFPKFTMLLLLVTLAAAFPIVRALLCTNPQPYPIPFFKQDCREIADSVRALHYTRPIFRRFRRGPAEQEADFVVPYKWQGSRARCEVSINVRMKDFKYEAPLLEVAESIDAIVHECLGWSPPRMGYDFLGSQRELFVQLKIAERNYETNITEPAGYLGGNETRSLEEPVDMNNTHTAELVAVA